MSNRSWFFAVERPAARSLSGSAVSRPDRARRRSAPQTLVWSEGMAGWQKAGEVPGLMAPAWRRAVPPAVPSGRRRLCAPAPAAMAAEPFSVDFGIWDFTWRSLLLDDRHVAWSFRRHGCRPGLSNYIVSLRSRARPAESGFHGQAGDIAVGIRARSALHLWRGRDHGDSRDSAVLISGPGLPVLDDPPMDRQQSQLERRAAGAELLGLVLAYIGWYILLMVSFFTIIGWAWVTTAWMRWICRNIPAPVAQIIFRGIGSGVSVANDRVRARLRLHHPDPVDAALVRVDHRRLARGVARPSWLRTQRLSSATFRIMRESPARAPSLPAPRMPRACRRA